MEEKDRNSGSDLMEKVQETAEDAAEQARSAGTAAFERARDLYEAAQEKAVSGARYADGAIRDNPYQAIGIAFGLGLLLGFLWKRK